MARMLQTKYLKAKLPRFHWHSDKAMRTFWTMESRGPDSFTKLEGLQLCLCQNIYRVDHPLG